jgi:hypothetical protein
VITLSRYILVVEPCALTRSTMVTPGPPAKGGSRSKHIGAKLALVTLHCEAAFCSQLPRRPIGRQAYGAYPARVNLGRFCMWDQ